ncbi:MAG: putative cytochrome [Modestobacter sp.]|jgi:cytochrome P450|nr:putative cytochrome [Modestobacter sp.]MCW2619523.1 putative cytochrome [Modestobacter sp.]
MAACPHGEKLVLDELPMPTDRDAAWRIMQAAGKQAGDVVRYDGGYALTAVDTVQAAMREPGIFSSKQVFDMLGSPVPMVPIGFDPPEQTRYRRILQPFFSPRRMRQLEDSLRQQLADLLDPLADRDEVEFISEVAGVFPTQAFLTLFGLPLEQRDQFIEWKDACLALSDAAGAGATADSEVFVQGQQKAGELFGYLTHLVQTRRGVPGDDVLSQLLCLEGEDELSTEEALGLCFLFVLAGLDTVTDTLGFGMERLARNPDRRQELVDDPSLIEAAVEELTRLDPPAPFVPRLTTEATVIGGQELPAGTRVMSFLAVANRDEDLFADPYSIDFHRPENPHVSFGMGPHRCLGSHLARLEMRLFYEEWHKRFPEYAIAPGTEPTVKWPRGTIGLTSLHLVLGGGEASGR